MKKCLRAIKDSIFDFILKHNLIISTIINIIILVLFYGEIERYFDVSKQDILGMIISISGTIFGFILTFLSIVIVFRTDTRYKKNKENRTDPVVMLVNNSSFDDVYELFIKSSCILGILLVISIVYYFTAYGLNNIVNGFFIVVIFELIVLGIIRVFLSVYTFNVLIRLLIHKNNQE